MPAPVVEPRPLPSRESRFVVALDAQDASYFAASLRISSFSRTLSAAIDPVSSDLSPAEFAICSINCQSPRDKGPFDIGTGDTGKRWPPSLLEGAMFRILLIIIVLAIGYDAVMHQGFYTRSIWDNIVGLVTSARNDAQKI